MKKKWNLTKYGKHIAFVCCGASIANVFVKSDLVQSIIWCTLGVALLCIILDDDKQIQRIMRYYYCAMQRNVIYATLPDEIT